MAFYKTTLLFFAVNALPPLVALLGLDRKRGDRAGFQALEEIGSPVSSQ